MSVAFKDNCVKILKDTADILTARCSALAVVSGGIWLM